MSDASQPPSSPTVRFGIATIADGLEACGLEPLTTRHVKAIQARGLDCELLVMRGVGASSRLGGSAIGIPYVENGKIWGLKHRTLTGEKRFTQDKGSRQIFYNIDCLHDATLKDHPIVITEGELDCMAALMAGYPRSVSVPGGAPSAAVRDGGERKYAFLDHTLSLFDGQKVILATDDDDPGRALREDLALRLGSHRCKWIRYPRGCKDLNNALREYGERGVQAALQTAKPMPIHGFYKLSELPELPDNPAFDTGIVGLDRHYKLRLGDLCVITGIPGHGKSSLINEICCRMAQKHGWKTVFASFEQVPQRDHRRALRSYHAEKLEAHMSPEEKAAADAWIERHFGFCAPDDDDEVNVGWLLERLAQWILRNEAKIVVIDPWNELDHLRAPDQTLTEYVGLAIKTLKKFARKYNIHLIVAAHPAKMARGKDGNIAVPGLYDISDSAHWANKPDVGIVVHRDSLADTVTRIRVLKSRYYDIGIPGEVKGAWNIERTRYTIMDGV